MFPLHPPTKHVFILGNNTLFEEGITKLLGLGAEVRVSRAKYTNDPAFLKVIEQYQPDVILVNESTSIDSNHILKLLFSAPALSALYIIIFRLSTNIVDVYGMPKRFILTKPDDLVNVVQGNFNHMVHVRRF